MSRVPPRVRLGLYRHWLGNVYEVVGTATRENDLVELVLYRAVTFPERAERLWARPREEFEGCVAGGVRRFSPIPGGPLGSGPDGDRDI